MLQSNTMRFGTDGFIFMRKSLLTAKQPLDTTGNTSVEGFTVEGVQPSGTMRRFIFKVDDKLYKFAGTSVVEYTGKGEFDDIIDNGNTAEEVAAVNDIPDWLNKKIYPIIALRAPGDATILPTAKLTLNVRNTVDTYEQVTESAEIELAAAGGDSPRIVDVTSDTTCTGQGSVDLQIRTKVDDEWSEYMPISAAKDKDAKIVQFKITYRVTSLGGTDSAKVNTIVIRSTMGAAAVAGEVAELYSIITNYDHTLGTCAVSIRHDPLIDSRIGAFVNFMKPTRKRKLLQLGVASGTIEQFILGVDGVKDTGVDQSTIQLFANGKPLLDFSYNTEVSEITVNTTAGAAITASYEYGHESEQWRTMALEVDKQPYDDGTYLTRFFYTLPDDEINNQSVSNVRIQIYRPTGHVTAESLGVATGNVQMFALQHAAKEETIECNAEFSCDPDSQIITCIAPKDTEIVCSYDWVGENPTIRQWTAGWSPAV